MPLDELWQGALAAVGRILSAAYALGWPGLLLLGIAISVAWSSTWNYDQHHHRRGRE
jgi:hypothetical protein